MLFVIAMMIEDDETGSMTLVQDAFVGTNEEEALGKALKLFKNYGSVHSYKVSFVSNDASEEEIQNLEHIDSQIIDFLHRGHKINAIKRYREITGSGLKESKEFIDDLISRHDDLLRNTF